jgi:hypothetical protein
MIFEITTGHDRHSVGRQHHEFSIKELEGRVPSIASRCDRWSVSLRAARVVSFSNSVTDVHSRRLKYGGHSSLSPNASNVAVRQDAAGNIKPDKERSRDRIDGISTLVSAFGRARLRDNSGVGPDRGIMPVGAHIATASEDVATNYPAGMIDIALPGGMSVRVDAQVDSGALRRVLTALARR